MTDRHWTVVRSRQVLKDGWISLRADDCVTPRGVEVDAYYVLDPPDFALVLAFDEADRAVLVRQYRHPLGGLSLELPGGVIDPGETALAAGTRELREETGYHGGDVTHIGALSPNPARYANRAHLIQASGVQIGPAAPEAAEDLEIVLVPKSELAALACSGAIISAMHVGLIMMGLFQKGR
ncbi:NUDIX hydrolase [Methylobacterium sp. WL7]|uniref:NUDIX hydrolase n=1 Tax=Methylobacterium sp. WL7 TaxID=2603900 RepID=UPI0011C72872|nr:NUDIX hydrolase [Methylobacterium sp. WL7]TXN41301.1 NUDIX hydrolase [Methylobacterium sp. WL7]